MTSASTASTPSTSPHDVAVSLEESLNQLHKLRDQMNSEFEQQMQKLRDLRSELETTSAQSAPSQTLFESPPTPSKACAIDCAESSGSKTAKTRLPPIEHADVDPNLEKSTLDELNEALAQAFSQMASK